jgi:hypothetical protein
MKVKTRRTVLIVVIVLVVVSVLSFLGRGWIRGSVVPAYVNHFYRSGIDKDFDHDFLPLNAKLKTYGFTFNNSDTLQDQCYKDAQYQGLQITVYCLKTRDSDTLPVTQGFIDKWKTTSPGLEKDLLSGGWQKQHDEKQPIAEIYDNPNSDVGTVYSKAHGKTLCTVTFGATQFPYGSTTFSQANEKTYVSEDCTRFVAFFDGY